MIIRCPHCEFSRSIGEHAIPAGAEHVTCPKCRHRFRFRTVDRAAEFEVTPPPVRHIHPSHEENATRPPDIWDAVDSLHQRWQRQMDEQVTDASIQTAKPLPPKNRLPESAVSEEGLSSPTADAHHAADPPEGASVKSPEAEDVRSMPEEKESGARKPSRSAFSAFLGMLPFLFSSRGSSRKKAETPYKENSDEASEESRSGEMTPSFKESGAEQDVQSDPGFDGSDASGLYGQLPLPNAAAIPDVPGSSPLPSPDPAFSAPGESAFGQREDDRPSPPEALLTPDVVPPPLPAQANGPHMPLADASLSMDPSGPVSPCGSTPESPEVCSPPRLMETPAPSATQGETPAASAPLPAAPPAPASPTSVVPDASQEPDDAHAFRPLFPYGLDDTPPEERVERDMLRLQSTVERPVKDLGRIEDLMPDEVEDEPYGAIIGEIPWESPEERGWGRGFINTVCGVMFGAPAFFLKVSGSGGLSLAFLFFLIQGYLAILCSVLWSYAAGTILDIPALYANKANLPFLLLLAPVALGLMLVLSAGGMRLALDLFSPKRVPFSLVGKIVCYSMAPMVLSVIPFIGPVAGTVWFFVAMAVAGRQIFSLSWFTSVFCTLPAAAVLVAGMLFFFL